MPLKILSVAYPFAPVGPHSVGGAEQILADLDRALVSERHQSIVIACEGSRTAGKLIPIPAPAALDETTQAKCRARVQAALDSISRSDHPDMIHMHGLDFHQYSVPEHILVLVTLHLPLSWYPAHAWTSPRGPIQFCCVSHSQRRTCPPELKNAIVIENGVDLPPESTQPRKNFALVLGRICPEKNAHEALEAGALAGIPVFLAGQVFPYPDHQRYFAQQIAPRLCPGKNGLDHRFLGPIGPERRNQLLAEAKCLLHPTLAPETSSLVAMEALASGTPVIAYRSGALAEIVEDGVTGFLVNDVKEMAEAIAKVPTLSSQACRSAAIQRFNRARMIRQYLHLYDSIARTQRPEFLHA
jgi:glycosyltransferase involved in cell wall biosynthesis